MRAFLILAATLAVALLAFANHQAKPIAHQHMGALDLQNIAAETNIKALCDYGYSHHSQPHIQMCQNILDDYGLDYVQANGRTWIEFK